MRHHKLHHYVLPHRKTHKKAHLLSEKALVLYVIFFAFLQIGFRFISQTLPGVLGTISAIIREEKAKNMFAKNYWVHISPSGKTPWVWIQQEGYNYRFAGENLARSFTTSNAVVEAWMASK